MGESLPQTANMVVALLPGGGGGGGVKWSTRSGRSHSLTLERPSAWFYVLVLRTTPYHTRSIVLHCIAGYTSPRRLAC